MLDTIRIRAFDDLFTPLDKRNPKGAVFCRIERYSDEIGEFILRCYESARKTGVIVEDGLKNPTQDNLSYYFEIMGREYSFDREFFRRSLRKWLPRLTPGGCDALAESLYSSLTKLRGMGKTDSMIQNAYVKFMCWLYYKFERIANMLGRNELPKILYEGEMDIYVLLLLSVISSAGCDVVALMYDGGEKYRRLDPQQTFSDALEAGGTAFPQGYSLKGLRGEIQRRQRREQLYTEPEYRNATNAWIKGEIFEDMLAPVPQRGDDAGAFFNCFYLVDGVRDKSRYVEELFDLYSKLNKQNRNVAVVNSPIAVPGYDEINKLRRGNYRDIEELIAGLSVNLCSIVDQELQKVVRKAFAVVMLEFASKDVDLKRAVNTGIYILCWFERYRHALFDKLKMPEVSCFLFFGECASVQEAYFIKFLARLPVDVAVFRPDPTKPLLLSDKLIFDKHYDYSLDVKEYPVDGTGFSVGTAAYHAERELDSIMYTDSGIYREHQFSRENTVYLKTMYEELILLWDEELRMRPGFNTTSDTVNVPAIFAKVSGVNGDTVNDYWLSVKKFFTPDTTVIYALPFTNPSAADRWMYLVQDFVQNGVILRDRIRAHPAYPLGFVRREVQELIFDKAQFLIDKKIIKGTLTHGVEYRIIADILAMDKNMVRRIQQFDFTKKNPKMLCISVNENTFSLDDVIYLSFLSLMGWDVLIFVPTGYECFGDNLNTVLYEEHTIGNYNYDLYIPNFSAIRENKFRLFGSKKRK